MTLHLRGIHATPNTRADVRVAQRVREETTERLRDEVETVRPLLRWPLKSTRREAA